jgi:hypothetical protein
MSGMSYVCSHIHCVFSTKGRRPRIPPPLRERKMSFQEEFLALLKKHRIPYDERYLWE